MWMPRRIGDQRWIAEILLMLSAAAILSIPGVASARGHVERAGDVLSILIPVAGLTTTLFYEDGSEGSVQFLKSFATSQVTTDVLKVVTHERRPNGSCCLSFPSGHTSASFMGAAFIDRRYGWRYAVPAYLGAAYVGYSRIYADKHYGIDVIAGAAIGLLSSYYFTKPYKGFNITAAVDADAYSLRVSRRW
jgi:membrane-associated phospholipid phosphatase